MKEPFDPKKRRGKGKRRKYVFTKARRAALKKAQRALRGGKSYHMAKRKKSGGRRHRSYDPEKAPSGRIEMAFVEPIVADFGGFTHELVSSRGISYPISIAGKDRDLVGIGVQVAGALADGFTKGKARAIGDLVNNFTTGYGVAALEDPPLATGGATGGYGMSHGSAGRLIVG